MKYVSNSRFPQVSSDLSDISDTDLRTFKQTYLPSYKAPFFQGMPWRKVDTGGYVSENHIRGHLAGRFTLGYPGKTYTKFCAVDVDRHNGESDSIIFALAERIIALFPTATPVVVQSSQSGGLHVYLFLLESSWTNRAHSYVAGILKGEGIRAEVYPFGTRNFRIPFGKGSFLLDSRDFTPLHSTNVESFRAFLWAIEHGKIEPLEIPPEFRATLSPSSTPRTPPKARTIDLSASTSPFMIDIDTLLLGGLQKPGDLLCLKTDEAQGRNKQMWLLTWHQKEIERKSDEDTIGLLNWWIETKHNGLSKDWDRDPKGVYKEIERMVAGFKPERVGQGLKTPGKGPQKRRQIHPNDYRKINRHIATLALTAPEKSVFEAILKHCYRWCDVSGEWAIAEIPSDYLIKVNSRYKRYMRRLEERNLVVEIAPHNWEKKQCRTYKVLLSG